MNLRGLKRNWNAFGKKDPLWAILSLDEKKGNKWDVEEFFAWGRDEIDKVLESVGALGLEVRRRQALDFGCGVGRLTQALAQRFEEAHGVDIAPSMIQLAERYNRHGDRCRYHLNDQQDLRLFPDAWFDFIYSNITLQHMEPKYSKGYIREFVRVLAPEGVLVFQIPSELDPELQAHALVQEALARDHPSVRTRIKPFIPKPVLDVRRWILARRTPVMSAHAVPRAEVVEELEGSGGRVVDIRPDAWTPGWVAYRYFVTRTSSTQGPVMRETRSRSGRPGNGG